MSLERCKPTGGRRALRFSLLTALCLLLGAATTVGVAWWCQWHRDGQRRVQRDSNDDAASGWPSWVGGNWPPPEEREVVCGRGWRRESASRDDPPSHWSALSESAGWPLLAMWRRSSWPVKRGEDDGALWMGLDIEHPRHGFMHLPVMPLFPGFALNTTLYASTWYLLLFTPLPLYRATRRRSRLSRGLCPACAYDLRASPRAPCPECGHDQQKGARDG